MIGKRRKSRKTPHPSEYGQGFGGNCFGLPRGSNNNGPEGQMTYRVKQETGAPSRARKEMILTQRAIRQIPVSRVDRLANCYTVLLYKGRTRHFSGNFNSNLIHFTLISH